MTDIRPACGVFLIVVGLAAGGCASLRADDLQEQIEVLEQLRAYELALATYDAEAAMDLFSDSYEGYRGSGKEGVGRMVERMAERESPYELDLSESVVTVDGDKATVEGVVALTGRWEMKSTYVLGRTDGGWKIDEIQFQR